NRIPEAHELAQHLGPGDHGYALLNGGIDFRITALDCARHYYNIGAGDVGRGVPDRDLCANAGQVAGHRIGLHVRALHGISQVDEHLGDAAHAAAADTNEMNRIDTAHAVAPVRRGTSLDGRPFEVYAPILVRAPFFA